MIPSQRNRFGPAFGADVVDFRLWAPAAENISLEIDGKKAIPLHPQPDGWHSVEVPGAVGARYRFRFADGTLVPDPASRFQPDGVHGPSVAADPDTYRWRNRDWRGRPWEEAVFYELHCGVLGGFSGVSRRLEALAALGITAIELMPVAEFPGSRNWGYDGVLPFAPSHAYGSPEALKTLVDEAHGLGLMVFLDVVYNHFGPDGNYLSRYAPEFFRDDIHTPWGSAIDFRRPEVRRYFTENALYWLDEFQFDGLRLDAVHAISEQEWITEMTAEVRAAFPGRHVHLVLENEHNLAEHMRGGVDAQWNDDFHNVIHVLLTGETSAYYSAFADRPVENLAKSLAEGFIYQGQSSSYHNGARRGTPSADLPPTAFINFLQNHDQVGNRALGERLTLLTDPESLKAAIALLLLSPQIPLIFMGEENGAWSRFLFFTDFTGDLADAVRDGRRKEFAAFPAFADPERRKAIPDPNALSTFTSSGLTETDAAARSWQDLYRSLLALRRTHIVPLLTDMRSLDAAVVGPKAVLARWIAGDRILTIACNLASAAVEANLPDASPIWGIPDGRRLGAKSTSVWLTPATVSDR
jgi:malto-oligosyltrehalose trehalohydrolase